MHYAEAHGHKQVVLGLRATGAAIDATNDFGVTPGHVARGAVDRSRRRRYPLY